VARGRLGSVAAVLAIWNIADSPAYRYFGVLHILASMIAFGPLFVYPTLRKAGGAARLAKLHMTLTLPALTLTWVLGMGLVGMSDDLWEMSDTWIVLSLLCWVVAMAVSWFLIRPAITDTSEAADKKFSAGIGITHVVLIVVLVLMVFKPGSGV
jgi:uncharacterized membrane protein